MKKYFGILLILLVLLPGCAVSEMSRSTEPPRNVQLANPWVSYETLEEAETAAGFFLSMPEEIGSFRVETVRVMNGQLLEVGYRDGDFSVTVRKMADQGQDISGVYEPFEKEITYQSGNSDIVSRFSGEVKILDLVDSAGYSWSVYAPNGYPEGYDESLLNALLDQPAWLREANEAFCATVWEKGITRASEISCFFSCTWSSPEEIDLAAFLRYCPLGEQLLDETTEEARAVIAAAGENPFLVTPVWRYPREAVSGLLRRYTGITVEELLSQEGILYLEEYDAFYNFTSDWGPGRFSCTGGEQSGDRITLWGEGNGDTARILTLREEEGTYYLMSYLDSGE